MPKKRKQAVGHPIEVELTDEEFGSRAFEALLVAEDRIEKLYERAARWKVAAKQWRAIAMATNPASMPWRKFRRELIRLGLQEKDDD